MENFKNTWNFALGVNYQVNSHFMMMLGAGYDQSPTKDGYRDIRMPDSDHTTVSLGTEVTVQKNITLNFGYAHIFMPKANVNNSRSKAGQLITEVGQAQANANLMTVQLNWVFQ